MDQGDGMSEAMLIGTSNRGYAQQAQEELRRLFSPAAVRFAWLAPGETFTFTVELEREEAVRRVLAAEPVFLRHMCPVDAQTSWNGTLEEAAAALMSAMEAYRPFVPTGSAIAVQARKPETETGLQSPSAIKSIIDPLLESQLSAVPVVRQADWILSVYMTGESLFSGLSRPAHNLSDWAGGAVRFRKEDGQVSRAKFKLLEAELAFGLDFGQYKHALDIGAAPGGWTSLLLERGLAVTAVDPAKLDASLVKHPKLTYLAKKADEVVFVSGQFDLLVCDMSWSHRQMTKLVRELMYALKPGGTAIITVKLMHKKAFQTIREVVDDFAGTMTLQQAKQLFHNRDELTLFLIRQ
nr:SAM-dependent methyltransferase [Paenibacillus sp. EPM92]